MLVKIVFSFLCAQVIILGQIIQYMAVQDKQDIYIASCLARACK